MQIKTITAEEFNSKSKAKTANSFKSEYISEVKKAITENKDTCITIDSLENAFSNYLGKSKAKPSKIVCTFFIQQLAKMGYSDASKGRVSCNNNNINLRL